MAAEKKGQTIVIKKITIVAGGHGGSWKVALADFMTALMCFFLVMWLLAQSAETKKAVSDYFSTPSIIEYNFSNFGVEITLEKLFLDLVNEPLKAFQSFMEPIDKTPNLLDMGSQKVVAAYLADQMQDVAKGVQISPDGFEFVIPDFELFEPGSAMPNPQFVAVMDRLKAITTGLEDSNVVVSSLLFNQSVTGSNPDRAKKVASERLDLVQKKIQASLESNTTTVSGNTKVEDKKGFVEGQNQRPPGFIKIEVKQKELKANGSKPRKLDTAFGASNADMSAYDNFVKQISDQKKKKKTTLK
ncbi:MAG: flagellar motor protein MotB [Pseudobdellovibrionaceae bacterium]